MPADKIKENEPIDVALRRFKRSCEKAGILSEVRRREYYEKPTQERKRKKAAAVKRHLKKLARESARRTRIAPACINCTFSAPLRVSLCIPPNPTDLRR